RPPFRHDGGACWWASLRRLPPPAAGDGRRAVLFEDGQPLPFADALHDDIRRLGGGRYSVWERGVYFAASDGSDPATNGRLYEVRLLANDRDGLLVAGGGDEAAFAAAFAARAARRSGDPPAGRRVMLLITSLGPGGAERQFCNLAKGLVARGHEVTLASLDGFAGAAGHYAPLLAGSGVRQRDLTGPADDFRPGVVEARAPGAMAFLGGMPDLFGHDAWRVLTHVAAEAPDVLHTALDKTNLLGAIAGVAVEVPRLVLSLRNVNPTHFPYLDLPWFQRWYRLAAAVPGLSLSANSAAGGADYAAWIGVPAARVHTVPNGLDEAGLRVPAVAEVQALRREHGIPDAAPVLAGVFRLSTEKRPLLWLDVVAALRRELPDLHALHVGHGPAHDAFRARIEALGLGGHVHQLGRQQDPFVALRAADLLLLVSTFEGIPNVALEAQWLERPVVCTVAGGSVEAVRDGATGFVVEPAAVEPLAAACARILRDREFGRRLGAAGRAFVRQQFALERMVDGSAALYA
ncbi:MAG: glycosyltransferase, partial [Planctomycetes bacterium]|nr:glycosyltransferase [Planctomycetota bacterium]